MTQKEFDGILKRYLQDNCSPDEKSVVDEWFESIQREDIFISNSREIHAKRKIWEILSAQLELKTKKRNYYWRYAAIAASIIVVIVSGIFTFYTYSKAPSLPHDFLVAVPAGVEIVNFNNTGKDVVKLVLMDGSTILLHPGSEIKYPKEFGETREVQLSGEAFFQISKDPHHPFLVHANEVTTRVLGTSFRVKAYKEQKDVVVAVSTGRVSVLSKTKGLLRTTNEVILIPNQQVIYSRNEGSTEKKLVETPHILIPAQSNELTYINEPVAKLFRTLEKMYGITIQFDEKTLSNCSITTEMTDEGLFERMDVICHVISATYIVKGTSIIVKASGCSN